MSNRQLRHGGRIQLTPKQANIYVWGWQPEARFRYAVCGRRFGKALALDTRLPTPSGWTTMGEVRVGDELFGPDGKACRVTYATDIMLNRPCNVVTFSDGARIVADDEHLWLTWDRCARKNAARNSRCASSRVRGGYAPVNDRPKVRSTAEIKATLVASARGDTNHSVECCDPVRCPPADLTVDPYVLGCWLGDGTGVAAMLSCNDPEIIEHIRATGQPICQRPHIPYAWRFDGDCRGGRPDQRARSLQTRLRLLGVLGNKHIPAAYLRASVEQRLSLLQGLMDTDGTVSAGGHCEFTNCNKALADGFLELARSLGIRATCSSADAKLYGRVTSTKHRITFTTDLSVFRLTRKAQRLVVREGSCRNIRHRFIVSIERTKSVPVRCIQVDSPSRLYLCSESFIPTHNTFLGCEEIRRAARLAIERDVPPDNEIWYGAPTFKQAKRVMWARLKRNIPEEWIGGRVNNSECIIPLRSGHIIRIVGLDDPDSLRGSGLWYFIGDEWDDAKPTAWSEAIRPMLGTAMKWGGGHALFIGTPKGFGQLYEGFNRGQPGALEVDGVQVADTMSWKYNTLEGGNVPGEEVENARRTLDPRTFRQEYEASFETYSGRIYYDFDRRENVRRVAHDPNKDVHVGLDFNINPMSASVFHERVEGSQVISEQFAEIVIPTSNTHEMGKEIADRYGRKPTRPGQTIDLSHITIYPDPAGAGRRTSAQGETDITILRKMGFSVYAMSTHPLVRDRINIVNSRIKTADGKRHFFVDPTCQLSIEAMEKHTYKEGTSEPEKGQWDHINDATGYYLFTRFAHQKAHGVRLVPHMAR